MSLQSIITTIQQDGSGYLLILIVMMSLVQISPIKFNPWTQLRIWISDIFNKEMNAKINSLEKDVEELKKSFEEIHEESREQKVDSVRMIIIDAARELKKQGGQVSDAIDIEFLSQVNKKCDIYEEMCEKYGISNGVATMSISYIREIYKQCVL